MWLYFIKLNESCRNKKIVPKTRHLLKFGGHFEKSALTSLSSIGIFAGNLFSIALWLRFPKIVVSKNRPGGAGFRLLAHRLYVRKVIIKNLTNFDLGAHGSCQHIPHLLMLSHKCQFWAKFFTHIKISWFCQISSSAGPEWSISFLSQICNTDQIFLDFVKFHPLLVRSGQNSHFWAKFSTRQKISGFCYISSSACPEWSNLSNFAPNFQRD